MVTMIVFELAPLTIAVTGTVKTVARGVADGMYTRRFKP
jgi:hypothetical protein